MALLESDLTMTDAWITDNTADMGGGGIAPVGNNDVNLLGITWKNNRGYNGELDDIYGSSPECGSTCDPGFYGNCTRESASPFDQCPSCVIGECMACPAGKVSGSGAIDVDDCGACSAGRYVPHEGAAACEGPCPAGSFVTDQMDDTDGFGVTVGGTHCLLCPAGRFSSEPGQGSCEACELGSTSSTGATACTSCIAGTYADTKAAETCTDCEAGRHAAASGAVACDSCAPGTWAPSGAAAACDDCDPGKYNTDGLVCTSCMSGTFASTSGSVSCANCAPGTSAPSGATACEACSSGTFSNDGTACQPCLEGTMSNEQGTGCITCTKGSETVNGVCVSCARGRANAHDGRSCYDW